MSTPTPSPLLRPRWPLGLLLLGACLPLARVLFDPLSAAPGSELSDVYKHVWSYWHTLQQVGEGSWPWTRYLNAPEGGLLMDVMLIPNLLMAPVTLTAGPVLASNLWVLLMVTAVGLATYALARRLTGSLAGSLCAGLLVQTSPFLLGHALTSGVHERLLIWVFPLTLLGLLTVRRQGGLRWALGLAGAALLTALSCPTYGLFLGVLLLLSLPLQLRWLEDAPRRPGAPLLPLLLSYAAVVLVLGGCAALYHWLVLHPDWLASIPQQRVMPSVGVTSPQFDVAHPASLFNPLVVQQEQPTRTDDELYLLVYLGWVPLAAMLGGLVVSIRRRRWLLLGVLVLALVFLLLSLGPWIDCGRVWLFNPFYHGLSYLVPYYGGAQPVWQQAGVFVGIGMVGVAALIGALPGRRLRWLVAMAIVVAAGAERVCCLPVPLVLDRAETRVPAIYDKAAGTGGLVEIPRFRPGTKLSVGQIFMAQTRHGHPLPVGININRGFFDSYSPLVGLQAASWDSVAHCLHRRGYRWVVVHRDRLKDPGVTEACVQGLKAAVGVAADDGVRALFDLSRLPGSDVVEQERCPGKGR